MRMPSMLRDCEEVKDFLMDYLDAKLPKTDSIIFRIHLLLCPRCRLYIKRYNTSVKIAQNILDDPPPDELVNLTNEFLRKRTKTE